ncbi:MAG TPA: SprT family zinc-dependent metalloprotease [Clostridia bacterium]|nr:SprT family zinc-dependent metalloprotease [Clostridia bacterium]
MKIYQLTYNEETIPCYITYKKVKNINLRINSKQEVKISVPRNISYQRVIDFIESKKKWILKKIKIFKEMININPKVVTNGTRIFYLGNPYEVRIKKGNNYFKIEDQLVCIYTLNNSQENIQKIYDQWQRVESKKIFSKFVNELYPLIKDNGINYPTIKIKKMVTRWGSCSYSKGNVNLNQLLVSLPENVIKYVVLHELVHFLQPNHSKDFYRLIEEYMPNYSVYRDYLKNIKLR